MKSIPKRTYSVYFKENFLSPFTYKDKLEGGLGTPCFNCITMVIKFPEVKSTAFSLHGDNTIYGCSISVERNMRDGISLEQSIEEGLISITDDRTGKVLSYSEICTLPSEKPGLKISRTEPPNTHTVLNANESNRGFHTYGFLVYDSGHISVDATNITDVTAKMTDSKKKLNRFYEEHY